MKMAFLWLMCIREVKQHKKMLESRPKDGDCKTVETVETVETIQTDDPEKKSLSHLVTT